MRDSSKARRSAAWPAELTVLGSRPAAAI